jgi:hypothetical protein
LKRALGWTVLVAGFGAWLFSDTLFPGNSRLYDAIGDGDVRVVRARCSPKAPIRTANLPR